MECQFFSDYFTSKLEIKPQPRMALYLGRIHYFTSKLEIKPQRQIRKCRLLRYYFTSKLEIKPQLSSKFDDWEKIILHQN